MPLIDDLNALRDSLRVTPGGPLNLASAGQMITAQLLPPGASPGVQLSVTKSIEQAISLSFVGKGAMFTDADLKNKVPSGTWPIYDVTQVPPKLVPGVPGVLGEITGTLSSAVTIPVVWEVKWGVYEAGAEGGRGRELAKDQDYVAPGGLNSPQVSVLLVPKLEELTADSTTPSTVQRLLHVQARLVAEGVTTLWTDALPDLALTAPALGFPAVLALFLEKNLLGGAFVMVPANSAFKTLPDLRNILDKLRTALSAIASVPSSAKPIVDLVEFLTGVNALINALQSSAQVLFDVKDEVPDLGVYVFDSGTLGVFGRLSASQSMDSLVFLGLPSERVECFANSPFITRDGWFSITLPTGEFYSQIADLESAAPITSPNPDAIKVEVAPPKHWFRPYHFANEIDSVNFGSHFAS